MADWEALPDGLVALIARKLLVIEDLVAFRSACSPWRKATALNDFYTSSSSPCPKLPLLMKDHLECLYPEHYSYAAENDPDGDHENNGIDSENYTEANEAIDEDEPGIDELDELENNGIDFENDTEANEEIEEDEPGNNSEFMDELDELEESNSYTVSENRGIDDADNDPEANDEMGENGPQNNESEDENNLEANDREGMIDYWNDFEANDEIEIDEEHSDHENNENNESEDENNLANDPEGVIDYWNGFEANDEIEIDEEHTDADHENNEIDNCNHTPSENENHHESNDDDIDNCNHTPSQNENHHESNDDDGQKFVRLIKRDGCEGYHERKFFSLSKAKTCNISFPELKHTLYRGSKGWLIIVKHYDLCLFHPISRVRIPLPKLPNQTDSEGYMIKSNSLRSVALSASPSETCDDYVVMVAFSRIRGISPGEESESKTYTAFWKPGNLTWRDVDLPDVFDLNYYDGKFYALIDAAHVWMCEASGPNPTTTKIVELPWSWSRPDAQLVECGGRLLLVAPYFWENWELDTLNDLEMVEIDVIKGSYKSIESLGSYAVFLGHNEGFSIDANTFPGIIEPNSIYFGNGSYQIAKPGPNHEVEQNWGSGVWLNF